MVVDRMHARQAEPRGQARGDLVALVVALAELDELCDECGVQSVPRPALADGQLQPLHIGRGAVIGSEEQCGKLPALGRRRLARPGLEQLVGLRHRCRRIESRRGTGGVDRRAVIGAVFHRVARRQVAFFAVLRFDGDDLGLEGRQPVEQAIEAGRIEAGRQRAQVDRAQHQHLGARPGHVAVERGQVDLCLRGEGQGEREQAKCGTDCSHLIPRKVLSTGQCRKSKKAAQGADGQDAVCKVRNAKNRLT